MEQLLFEMDVAGVERAAVVCARIDHNPDNNDYVAECVARFPERLIMLADVDCSWTETYHTPGAAGRLARRRALPPGRLHPLPAPGRRRHVVPLRRRHRLLPRRGGAPPAGQHGPPGPPPPRPAPPGGALSERPLPGAPHGAPQGHRAPAVPPPARDPGLRRRPQHAPQALRVPLRGAGGVGVPLPGLRLAGAGLLRALRPGAPALGVGLPGGAPLDDLPPGPGGGAHPLPLHPPGAQGPHPGGLPA